ncbi:MAG: ABC transporter ATP-binding protein [Hyphomicrobiaceae bacterium]
MTSSGHIAEVRNLDVVYGNGLHAVVGASLSIGQRETVGLVGESGSGKSSLAKALVGLQRISRGQAFVDGRDVAALNREGKGQLRRTVQMIFQDPVSSLSPRMTIGRLLAEPLAIHGVPRSEHRERIGRVLEALGVRLELLEKYPHQVSGGQARRIGIARALVLEPKLIIADEPTAGLDVSVQGDLLNLMVRLQDRLGLAYLIVSHNLGVIRRMTDRVAVMYLGRIVEEGPTPALFQVPGHPYTQGLIAANPVIDPDRTRKRELLKGEIPSLRQPPSGCRFHPRCRYADAFCSEQEPEQLEVAPRRHVACHRAELLLSE